jgi:hypothetical protein
MKKPQISHSQTFYPLPRPFPSLEISSLCSLPKLAPSEIDALFRDGTKAALLGHDKSWVLADPFLPHICVFIRPLEAHVRPSFV